MEDERKEKIRSFKDGDWYWIDKAIIHRYGQRLKPSGLAVYNALASFSNSRTQACFPSQNSIAELIGASRRTVARKIRILRKLGLIRVERKGSGCCYRLLSLQAPVPKKTATCDKNGIGDVIPGNNNKNHLTRIINNNVNEDKKISISRSSMDTKPRTREDLLALDLARELNDLKYLPAYRSYARKYPEGFLRRLLSEVKEIPMRRIKKGRAALFNYLINQYGKKASEDPGD